MPDQNDIVFSQQTIDLGAIIRALLELLLGNQVSTEHVLSLLSTLWFVAVIVLLLLSALFLYGFIYASIRFNQLAEEEAERIKKAEELWQDLYGRQQNDSRLRDIEQHTASDNPNDWKLAIIEADIELGRMLDRAGFIGNTIGEQLKGATTRQLASLDDAWEAHKVRNQIAHEGADFVLTKKLAQDTITRYRRVFSELEVG